MEKLQILERILPGYTERYLKAEYGLDEMPLLDAITNNYEAKLQTVDMSGIYLIACQHMLEPQLRMFKKLIALGFPAQHIFILPKIYSVDEDEYIIEQLEQLGCNIFREALNFPLNQSFDSFHEAQCKNVLRFVLERLLHAEKLLLLDDGGMLIKTLFANRLFVKLFKDKVFATEQTASGKNAHLKRQQPFLIDSVASSFEKLQIETDYIIRLCSLRIGEHFKAYKITTKAKVLIKGLGPIGATLFSNLLGQGYDCVGYDKKRGKPTHALDEFDVIIAATGDSIVTTKNLSKLKRGCHLISVSSSDREFPAAYLRRTATTGSRVHDVFWNAEYDLYLVNGGFPITFYGNRTECYPLEMDVTMMKLLESIMNHILGQRNVETSVNYLYADKMLYGGAKWAYIWFIVVGSLCCIKLWLYGWPTPESDIGVLGWTGLLITISPLIWGVYIVRIFKKLERL